MAAEQTKMEREKKRTEELLLWMLEKSKDGIEKLATLRKPPIRLRLASRFCRSTKTKGCSSATLYSRFNTEDCHLFI